jgi:hypothetical protein
MTLIPVSQLLSTIHSEYRSLIVGIPLPIPTLFLVFCFTSSYSYSSSYFPSHSKSNTVGYARTDVTGSRTSFVTVSVRSSAHWNVCIWVHTVPGTQQCYHPTQPFKQEKYSCIKIDQLMSLALLFQYLLLNMFRMLVHPSSGSCDLFVELFHRLYCSSTIRVGVVLQPASGYHTIPAKPQSNTNAHRTRAIQPINNSTNNSQASEDGCINIRNIYLLDRASSW